MKILIFVLLLFFNFSAFSQNYVKIADKPEYEKYLKYCNVRIQKEVVQFGKYKVLKVNGVWKDSLGISVAATPVKIIWSSGTITPEGRQQILVEPNEDCIHVTLRVTVFRRKASISDFYTNWKTKKIQNGLVSN